MQRPRNRWDVPALLDPLDDPRSLNQPCWFSPGACQAGDRIALFDRHLAHTQHCQYLDHLILQSYALFAGCTTEFNAGGHLEEREISGGGSRRTDLVVTFHVIGTAIGGQKFDTSSILNAPLLDFLVTHHASLGRPGAGSALALSLVLEGLMFAVAFSFAKGTERAFAESPA